MTVIQLFGLLWLVVFFAYVFIEIIKQERNAYRFAPVSYKHNLRRRIRLVIKAAAYSIGITIMMYLLITYRNYKVF